MSSNTKKAPRESTSANSRPRLVDDRAPEADGERVSIDEQIRLRAYELYMARGAQPNDDLGDWLRAERELRQGTETEAPGPAAS